MISDVRVRNANARFLDVLKEITDRRLTFGGAEEMNAVLHDEDWQQFSEGHKTRQIDHNLRHDVTLLVSEITAGTKFPQHTHAWLETFFLAAGQVRFSTDTGSVVYSTGDCWQTRQGVPHAFEAITNVLVVTSHIPPLDAAE